MERTDDFKTLIEISRMYYIEGMTQQNIANKMNMSRSLISKLLNKARNKGIVTITINNEVPTTFHALENYVKSIFGLKKVIIVADNATLGRHNVIKEAQRYFLMRLPSVKRIAISAGRTTREIADSLPFTKDYFDVTFVPMSGGLSDGYSAVEANEVTETFAQKTGAKNLRLHAPIVVDSIASKAVFEKQFFLKNVLDEAKKADLALVGIGNTLRYADVQEAFLHGYNKDEDLSHIDIAGDLSYNFFDKNGIACDCNWNNLVIGLSLEDIKAIPEVICVAYDIDKAESLYVAARRNLFDTLIISESIAHKILFYHTKTFHLNERKPNDNNC